MSGQGQEFHTGPPFADEVNERVLVEKALEVLNAGNAFDTAELGQELATLVVSRVTGDGSPSGTDGGSGPGA